MIQVDNTLLCDVAKCDAAAIARHVLHLSGTEAKIEADMGNVFHPAMEAHFGGRDKAAVVEVLRIEHVKLFPNNLQPENVAFSWENCRRVMERYVDVRPVERFPFVVLELEKVVGAPLADGIMFYAKRDMRVQDRQSGLSYPVDHKMRIGGGGNITEWWTKKFRMSSQMSGYCWMEQQQSGQPCGEAWVNALGLIKVPNSTSKCRVHKVPYLECGPEHVPMQMLVYQRRPEQIEAWRRDAVILARHFDTLKRTFPSVEYLPAARRNGAFNDGCTFCEFKKWCAVDFSAGMQSGLVEYAEWAPWNEGSSAQGFGLKPVYSEGQPYPETGPIQASDIPY